MEVDAIFNGVTMKMKQLLRQITLVHVSDVHFGRKHICVPAVPGGSTAGVHLATEETSQVALNRLYVVPGNHDVVFKQQELAPRWQPYCSFYSGLFQGARPAILDRNAGALSQVHDRSSEGIVIAEINSALYVREDSDDASRGQVDGDTIRQLRQQLAAIDQTALNESIRIALMHHHPVLLPSLVEGDRGYDAIANSHALLRLLQEFGFHLVLHGHKHYPQTFSYDPDYAWSKKPAAPALLIVAGGSTGSEALPKGTRATNSYNIVTIKWHPEARQGRIRVETRGLKRLDDDGPLTPDLWTWETLFISDRVLGPTISAPRLASQERLPPLQKEHDGERRKRYEKQRNNMAVAEVMPSLVNGQAYEARVWIVPHHDREEKDIPEEVIWNAGWRFNRIRVTRAKDESFSANFSYWGSMMVEAIIKFKDGETATAYVYARIPDGRTPKKEE